MCLPCRMALRAGRRLGRRGAYLLSMGTAWVAYGAAVLLAPTPPAQVKGLTVLTTALPLDLWGWVWLTAGVVGVAFSPVRTVGTDQIGFTALVIPPTTWALGYLLDWILIGDYSRGWVVATTYGSLAASTLIASGWPEIHGKGRRVR